MDAPTPSPAPTLTPLEADESVNSLQRTVRKLHAAGNIDRLLQVALGIIDGVGVLRDQRTRDADALSALAQREKVLVEEVTRQKARADHYARCYSEQCEIAADARERAGDALSRAVLAEAKSDALDPDCGTGDGSHWPHCPLQDPEVSAQIRRDIIEVAAPSREEVQDG